MSEDAAIYLPGLSHKHVLNRRADDYEKKRSVAFLVVSVQADGQPKLDYDMHEMTVQTLGQLLVGLQAAQTHLLAVARRNAASKREA